MANTRYLTTVVEQFVRDTLRKKHAVEFSKKFLDLNTGGRHEFDAVSSDGQIVASIKATSGRTKGGNLPQGKFNNAITEIYYLSLVEAPRRLLVVTFLPFYDLLLKKIHGALATDIEIVCEPLPIEMQAEVDRVLAVASGEVSREQLEAAVEAEDT